MQRIRVGTAAWADKELIESGLYFPPGCASPEERLRFYAAEFPLVEIDTSYYAIPQTSSARQWAERTPADFLFDIKAFRLFTGHGTDAKVLPPSVRAALPASLLAQQFYYRDIPDELRSALWRDYVGVLKVLQAAGKLGVVLFQFPPWFPRSVESHRHIEEVRARLPDFDLAVEFRNESWLNAEARARTLAFLSALRISLMNVDEPQGFASSVPPTSEVTGAYGLVRFHGRNAETWEKKGLTAASARFDYLYRPGELQSWVTPIFQMAEEAEKGVHVIINTNHLDQGPQNARILAAMLGTGLAGPPQRLL